MYVCVWICVCMHLVLFKWDIFLINVNIKGKYGLLLRIVNWSMDHGKPIYLVK